VAELGAAHPAHRVGPGVLLQREPLVAHLVDRLLAADLLILAVDQLHRRLQPVLAVPGLAHRRALDAMPAEAPPRIAHALVAHPHRVLDHRVDRAADRAVRAHGPMHFALDRLGRLGGAGRIDGAVGKLARKRTGAGDETRALEERAPVHGADAGAGNAAHAP